MTQKQTLFGLFFLHLMLVVFLLVFTHHDRLYLAPTHLAFITVMVALGALYRPRWACLFLIGLIPLEFVSLGKDFLPFAVRPYQLVAGALLLSTFVHFFIKRRDMVLPRFTFFDYGLVSLIAGSFLSSIFAFSQYGLQSLKLTLILMSYVVIYYLLRIHITQISHLRMPVAFLALSVFLVSFYGYIQNILFLRAGDLTGVMPGRPNASFAEADWFGMFLVFVIAMTISTFVFFYDRAYRNGEVFRANSISLCAFLALLFLHGVLILTVARSAWVGYVCLLFAAVLIMMFRDVWHTLRALIMIVIVAAICALFAVQIFGLTRFDLGDRALSAGSGLQEITIACVPSVTCTAHHCELPSRIDDVSELQPYNCTHIDLEEIVSNKDRGLVVTTIDRPDPNVDIRKDIYNTSLQAALSAPIVGIGWGSIGQILGVDGAGTTLNSSNIFLQVWLSAGVLGLIGFIVMVIALIARGLVLVARARRSLRYAYGLFILLGGIAILIPNLFNAGLLLGYVWVYFAFSNIAVNTSRDNGEGDSGE